MFTGFRFSTPPLLFLSHLARQMVRSRTDLYVESAFRDLHESPNTFLSSFHS
jgi:hypothetical protein